MVVVDHRLFGKLTVLMNGVIERKWNVDQLVVLPVFVIQQNKGVTQSKDIRRRILCQLDLRESK